MVSFRVYRPHFCNVMITPLRLIPPKPPVKILTCAKPNTSKHFLKRVQSPTSALAEKTRDFSQAVNHSSSIHRRSEFCSKSISQRHTHPHTSLHHNPRARTQPTRKEILPFRNARQTSHASLPTPYSPPANTTIPIHQYQRSRTSRCPQPTRTTHNPRIQLNSLPPQTHPSHPEPPQHRNILPPTVSTTRLSPANSIMAIRRDCPAAFVKKKRNCWEMDGGV
ncbi:hypothetical protein BDU57DRAFT_167814 [Ampelomyces quisqualis]|uniref:Uncharacterized protein n=1 Tax=Ampelomyces quisqualis TaxID=50730 RepID=A0A6A5QP35_AMPQU|nr:hypothetical protein BDU57DRAFT_167814 [Ampelomyces quisqualis]